MTSLLGRSAPRAAERGSADPERLLPTRPRSRRQLLAAASAVVIVTSIAGFMSLYSSARRQQQVVVVTRTIEQGQIFNSTDLGQANASLSDGLQAIPVSLTATLSGKRAAVTVPAGSLLVPGDVTSAPAIPPGEAVVGIALKDGQYPSTGVQTGSQVMVVQTASPGSPLSVGTTSGPSSPSNGSEATAATGVLVPEAAVFDVTTPGANSGGTVSELVSVEVPTTLAASVSTAAAADQVSLVLLPDVASGTSGATGGGATQQRRDEQRRDEKRWWIVMTVVAFASVKGSPGVTTLTCLVAAKWSSVPVPIVVECDPAGGDLAARFGLSSRGGWTSLAAALRREGSRATLEEHLQRLPGGLDVLVGTESTAATDHTAVSHVLDLAKEPGARDLLVDIGRLPVREDVANRWLGESDEFVLVSRADPASLISVHLRAASLTERCGPKLGLVVVGPRRHTDEEIEAFTGVRLLGRVPWDSKAAAVASGEDGGDRRLSRSRLVASAARIASELARASSESVRCSEAEVHSMNNSAR